jgi:hypothetical protein
MMLAQKARNRKTPKALAAFGAAKRGRFASDLEKKPYLKELIAEVR